MRLKSEEYGNHGQLAIMNGVLPDGEQVDAAVGRGISKRTAFNLWPVRLACLCMKTTSNFLLRQPIPLRLSFQPLVHHNGMHGSADVESASCCSLHETLQNMRLPMQVCSAGSNYSD